MGESRPKRMNDRLWASYFAEHSACNPHGPCDIKPLLDEAIRSRASEADGIKAAEKALEALGNARANLNANGHDTDETHVFQMAEVDAALAALRSFLAKAKGEG